MDIHNDHSFDELMNYAEADILAISIDYRPTFVAEMRAIVAAEFSGQGIADDEGCELIRHQITALLEEAAQYFPLGNIPKLQSALADFRRGLFAKIAARQAEKRKSGSFANQIEKFIALDEFRTHAFGRSETSALESLCRDGDQITEVTFDYITVERDGVQRQITCFELIEATMPTTSSYESWRKAGGFASDSKIKERRESAQKAAFHAANPDSGRAIIHSDGTRTRA